MTEIKEVPFSWNTPLAEEAQEYFSLLQPELSYHACSAIGIALAKLGLLEMQGAEVDESQLHDLDWSGGIEE